MSIADPVVEQPSIDDVAVVLDVNPISEPVVIHPVQQLVPPLNKYQVPYSIQRFLSLLERLVVDKSLKSPVVNYIEPPACDPVLVKPQDVLPLFCLCEEADGH